MERTRGSTGSDVVSDVTVYPDVNGLREPYQAPPAVEERAAATRFASEVLTALLETVLNFVLARPAAAAVNGASLAVQAQQAEPPVDSAIGADQ
eukprot:5051-Heterococcus_DN1.PRE.1